MPFALKAKNEPARFYSNETREEWVDLKALTPSELAAIRKKTVAKRVEYYTPPEARNCSAQPFRYEIEDFDSEAFQRLFWDAQIVDWSIKDENGNEIPCTLENKMLLIENSNEFGKWVLDSLAVLEKDLKDRVEKSEKN